MRVCARLRDLSVLAILILSLAGPVPRAIAEDAFVLNRPLPKLESLLPRTTQRGSLVAPAPRHVIAQAPAVTAADPICDIFANGYDATATTPCATCFDGATDYDETDADCGGAWCTACADGKQCLVGSDCISTLCNPGPHTCSPATCLDNVKDYGESDVDCGGGACPQCASGLNCIVSSDCLSNVCTFGVCAAPTCTDAVRNGTETDVDCGGGTCFPCATGKQCLINSDCVSGVCSGSNICQ